MTRRRFALAFALIPGTLRTAFAQGSNFGAGRPEERYFAVDATVTAGRKGPTAEGYVTNRYALYATRVRLNIEALDAAGRSLGTLNAGVGEVPPLNRTFFQVPVPPGTASVRAAVASYDWTGRGGA
jgi:hypothetical protein